MPLEGKVSLTEKLPEALPRLSMRPSILELALPPAVVPPDHTLENRLSEPIVAFGIHQLP